MRSLLGERTVGDSRTLELKVGQVVRGVVTEVLSDSEAIIQIQGVHVRAKLETMMQVGQSALLHVEPQSSGNVIVFKQVDALALGLMETSLREMVQQLGLPDEQWALVIAKDLRLNGLSVQRATIQFFEQAMALLPQGANNKQWLQAATLLLKRGMPPTSTSIAAIQQVLFDKAPHELLQQFSQLLRSEQSVMGNNLFQTSSSSYLPIAQKLIALMETLPPTIDTMDRYRIQSDNATTASNSPQPIMSDLKSTPSATSAEDKHPLAQLMKQWGLDYERSLAKSVAVHSSPSVADQEQPTGQLLGNDRVNNVAVSQGSVDHTTTTANAAKVVQQTEQHVQTTTSSQAKLQPESLPLRSDIQMVGTEKMEAPKANHSEVVLPAGSKVAETIVHSNTTFEPAASPIVNREDISPPETLKSLLLQLLAASDTPPAVKELANQLLLQVTGQQLLLSAERNQTLFSHVTMMIPLQDEAGGKSATIHVQTRRNKSGQLDAENCRLVFHLTMNALGETMVDVNVANRLVSVKVANNHPIMATFIQSTNRTVLSDHLATLGYQLSGLMMAPLPDKSVEKKEEFEKNNSSIQSFSPTRYKGVDLKV
ncbi:hypothetical protein ACFSTH_20750 [Paenibacillus yanchengensis]